MIALASVQFQVVPWSYANVLVSSPQVVAQNQGTGVLSSTFDFQPFPETEQAVKDDVEWLRSNGALATDSSVSGWIYEVETGKTRQIV